MNHSRLPSHARSFVRSGMPLTYILVALSVLLTLVSSFGDMSPLTATLLISLYVSGMPEFYNGEYWRIITPVFLHFHIFHLVFNLLWLWYLGSRLEVRLGTGLFFAMFLVTGIVSNLAQYTVTGPLFGGMSGVVYGLFGIMWMQSRHNPYFFHHLPKQYIWLMMVWFGVCWTGLVGNVANYAHTGGLVTGIVWGLIYAKSKQRKFFSQ